MSPKITYVCPNVVLIQYKYSKIASKNAENVKTNVLFVKKIHIIVYNVPLT